MRTHPPSKDESAARPHARPHARTPPLQHKHSLRACCPAARGRTCVRVRPACTLFVGHLSLSLLTVELGPTPTCVSRNFGSLNQTKEDPYLFFLTSPATKNSLPNSVWANGIWAEVARQRGKMVEHPNKSQPNPGLQPCRTPRTVVMPSSCI